MFIEIGRTRKSISIRAFERKKCDKIMLKMSQNNSERERGRESEKERRQCL
jgi:hypothetical protein